MNDDTLATIVGRDRTVGCAMELSAEIFTPGLVKRNTAHKTTWFAVGELDGLYTQRVKEIAAKELGIPTPCQDAVVEIDRQINTGEIKMDRSNFELLKAKVATAKQ